MTDRLADVSARIDGIEQLGAVVNAMKGIAAARARVARTQIAAIDSYAVTIATAMSSALAQNAPPRGEMSRQTLRKGLLVFCAEQGFAGAFSEHVLESIEDDLAATTLFLVGTRGLSIAKTRGLAPVWSTAMPSHTPGIPKMADHISKAIYQSVDDGTIDSLDVVYSGWTSGQSEILRHPLFPIDLSTLAVANTPTPMMQLPTASLIDSLSADYFHALVCKPCRRLAAKSNGNLICFAPNCAASDKKKSPPRSLNWAPVSRRPGLRSD